MSHLTEYCGPMSEGVVSDDVDGDGFALPGDNLRLPPATASALAGVVVSVETVGRRGPSPQLVARLYRWKPRAPRDEKSRSIGVSPILLASKAFPRPCDEVDRLPKNKQHNLLCESSLFNSRAVTMECPF